MTNALHYCTLRNVGSGSLGCVALPKVVKYCINKPLIFTNIFCYSKLLAPRWLVVTLFVIIVVLIHSSPKIRKECDDKLTVTVVYAKQRLPPISLQPMALCSHQRPLLVHFVVFCFTQMVQKNKEKCINYHQRSLWLHHHTNRQHRMRFNKRLPSSCISNFKFPQSTFLIRSSY